VIILVSGATATLREYSGSGHFGQLIVPRSGNVPAGLPWACDNDAFSGFDATTFRKMLARVQGKPGCLFVACPDVVCDPAGTLVLFREWSPEIASGGQPIAFVGQDGCESGPIPWDQFQTLFIGGSTQWKESRSAMALCDQAKSRGKWVHVGRVNTLRRIRKLWDWGTVDSVDGTTFSKWPRVYMPEAIRWLSTLGAQPTLFGEAIP
jgi:hypothetical protein